MTNIKDFLGQNVPKDTGVKNHASDVILKFCSWGVTDSKMTGETPEEHSDKRKKEKKEEKERNREKNREREGKREKKREMERNGE